MGAPICDFVRRYAAEGPARLHMPGHKGSGDLGELRDITEIDGADDLFAPHGIIAESEENASRLFGARTLYSAGGSTLCIQAMLYLTALAATANGKTPTVLAGRNAHKAFVHAAALLHIAVRWIYPDKAQPYYSGRITAADVKAALCADTPPTAVYITTPDYLGNTVDVAAIAAVCHASGVPLLVDNAHGAYLKFLPQSRHPLDLGADMCCDSAHKTLPVLTGGAYLHIADSAPTVFHERAIEAMALFGSSSPSYLILQSLDAVNDRLPTFAAALERFLPQAATLRERLAAAGFETVGDEPLKLTVNARSHGCSGRTLATLLMDNHIYPEFYDADFLVLMLTPENRAADIERLLHAFGTNDAVYAPQPTLPLARGERVCSVREALFAPRETIPAAQSLGRVCGTPTVGCPPAIPIAVSGEQIGPEALELFRRYGVEQVEVLR